MLKFQRVRWLYSLTDDFSIYLGRKFNTTYYLYDQHRTLWACLSKEGKLTIKKGYSWDGCTPKVKIGKHLIGVPDGALIDGVPITSTASLVHDVFYQFYGLGIPLSRKEIDLIFLELLDEFHQKNLYYWGVRIFGGIAAWNNYRKNKDKLRVISSLVQI